MDESGTKGIPPVDIGGMSGGRLPTGKTEEKSGAARRLALLCRALPLLLCLGLLALVLYNVYTLNREYFLILLDADALGEIGLAEELARQGQFILTDTWYYSTELRVLHNQLVMAPLFFLFSDPLFVHLLSTLIISGMMALCGLFLFRGLGAAWWQSVLAAALVITPFSREVFWVNLSACYYSFFVLCTMLFLGLFLRWLRAKGHWREWLFVLMMPLALVMGLCGIRYFLLLYLPLVLAALAPFARPLNRAVAQHKARPVFAALTGEDGRALGGAVLFCAVYGIGLLLNATALHGIYSFKADPLVLSGASAGKYLRELVWSFLRQFSADPGRESLFAGAASVWVFLYGLLLLASVAVLVWLAKREKGGVALYIRFVLASLAVTALTCVFLEQGVGQIVDRYLILGIMPLVSAPVLLLRQGAVRKFSRRVPVLALCLGVTLAAPAALRAEFDGLGNPNRPVQETAAWLVEGGYEYGLATHWQSAPLRLFSGGRLQTLTVRPTNEGFARSLWLEAADDTVLDENHDLVFVALDKSEYEVYSHLLEGCPVIYEYDNLIVLEARLADIPWAG